MSVRGIRQAGNLRAGETAPLPGSSCAVAWSACQQLSTLASPVCSAGSCGQSSPRAPGKRTHTGCSSSPWRRCLFLLCVPGGSKAPG